MLSILAVGYYLNVVFGFNVYTLQVCGRIRLLVGVNLFMASLNIGLCFALADALGAVGIAIANCAALTAQNLINQWASARSIDTGFIPRECWSCYLHIVAGSRAAVGVRAGRLAGHRPQRARRRAGVGGGLLRLPEVAAAGRDVPGAAADPPAGQVGALTGPGPASVGGRPRVQPGRQLGVAVGAERGRGLLVGLPVERPRPLGAASGAIASGARPELARW